MSPVLEAGKLRHRIEIVQLTLQQDAKGNIKARDESPIATVWASIQALTGRELYSAQQKVAEVTHRITIRYMAGIKAGMNIWFNDPGNGLPRQFQIQTVENPDETRHMLSLLCLERDDAVRETGL